MQVKVFDTKEIQILKIAPSSGKDDLKRTAA
jgi:hypothetical protein